MIEIENPGDRFLRVRNPQDAEDERWLTAALVEGGEGFEGWEILEERAGPPPDDLDDEQKERLAEEARWAAMSPIELARAISAPFVAEIAKRDVQIAELTQALADVAPGVAVTAVADIQIDEGSLDLPV